MSVIEGDDVGIFLKRRFVSKILLPKGDRVCADIKLSATHGRMAPQQQRHNPEA